MKPFIQGAAVIAAIGTIAGGFVTVDSRYGVQAMDARYVKQEEYKDLQWVLMKRELRELADLLAEHPSEKLERAYEEALAVFCRNYPEDPECE